MKDQSMSDQAAMVEKVAEAITIAMGKAMFSGEDVATALTKAAIQAARPFIENDALERAASEVERIAAGASVAKAKSSNAFNQVMLEDFGFPLVADAMARTAKKIRSLKHSGSPPTENDLSRGSRQADGGHINPLPLEGERG